MFQNWMRLTRDTVLLGLETQRVMALRLMKLSRGGRAAGAPEPRRQTTSSPRVNAPVSGPFRSISENRGAAQRRNPVHSHRIA